ncbi:MAG: prepilin-type N-terminal cleavage/methylation domain-containing protein [Clostridia bacterium]|nr:prepilin-type N-terminal cleavage/methylation domain-containing protein [Clostridia bacterium]
MKKLNNKGFTIVELVIVVAVIAILAAVLIPTVSGLVKTAQTSADVTLVKNVNLILATERATEGKNATMQEALDDALEGGYDVTKLTPTNSDNYILWDQESDNFVLFANGKYNNCGAEVNVTDEYKLWNISKTTENSEYSVYYIGEETEVTVNGVGFDAGSSKVASVVYKSNDAQSVIIRTNGGSVTVNAPAATVHHYGEADSVDVTAIANASYHVYGKVSGNLQIKEGRLVVENGANVPTVIVTAETTGKVTVEIKSQVKSAVAAVVDAVAAELATSVTGNAEKLEAPVSSDSLTKFAGGLGTEASPYLIATAEQFANIKEIATNGKSFKLIDDIEVSFAGNYMNNFAGTIDGNGNTLSITATSGSAKLIGVATDTTIKNLKVNTQNGILIRQGYGAITFDNVDVAGKYSTTGSSNESAYLFYFYGTTLTFENCDASYDLNGDRYQAIFLGGYVQSSHDQVNVIFKNLTYSGRAYSNNVALLAGNGANWLWTPDSFSNISITVENCVNKGTIISYDSNGTQDLFCATTNNQYKYDPSQLYSSSGSAYVTLGKMTDATPVYDSANRTISLSSITNSNIAQVKVVAYTQALIYNQSGELYANGRISVYQEEFTEWSNETVTAKYAAMSAGEYSIDINSDAVKELLPDRLQTSTFDFGGAECASVVYDFYFCNADGDVIGMYSLVVNP